MTVRCDQCLLKPCMCEKIFDRLENPKKKFGAAKVGVSNIPIPVMREVGAAMNEGADKYGAYNWRESEIDAETYFNSTRRHLDDWWDGEDIDPDSGIHHVSKAISSLMVLRDSMLAGTFEDNRPLTK
ncbi:MAG: hypothetical protein JKY93_12310 [Gammaproteobacteria bacterium]|nr:hypothetical protein [Gammaproteobacteria bacterium]